MPNTRGQGQKLIPVPADEKFIAELNAGFKKVGYSNRSQFIRDAIVEKLSRMGVGIAKKFAAAPDRIGKGGRQLAEAAVPVARPKSPVKKSGKPVQKKRSSR